MTVIKSTGKSRHEILLDQLELLLDADKGDLVHFGKRLKALEEQYGKEAIKAAGEELERVKAKQEELAKAIKANRKNLYIPGIEDEKFSLRRAVCGFSKGKNKQAFESVGAGLEFEVLKQVFDKHASTYFNMPGVDIKSQNVSDHELGAALIPDQVISDIIPAIYTRSVFINLSGEGTQRISVLEGLSGTQVKIPKFTGGMVAVWIDEEEDPTESFAKAGDISMTPHKLVLLTSMTKEMMMLGGSADGLFNRDMTRAMAKKLDWTIAFGVGGKMPLGIVNTPDVKIWSAQAKALIENNPAAIAAANGGDWTGGVLDFDGLEDMDLEMAEDDVDQDESSLTVSSKRFFSRLKRLRVKNFDTQTDEKPYLLGVPMLSDAKLADFIGPFDYTSQIKSNLKPGAVVGAPSASGTSKFTTVFRGNMAEVVLGRWASLILEDDGGKGVGFGKGRTYIKMSMLADQQIRQARALRFCPDARARD